MDNADLLQIHQRILAGDTLAAAPLVEAVLEPMVGVVKRTVPQLYDPHDVEAACLDALLEYLEAPSSYAPAKSALFTYLTNKARWRALTTVRSHARRRKTELAYIELHCEQSSIADPLPKVEGDILDALLVKQLIAKHGGDIVKDDGDEEIFLLMAAGERFADAYLEALGLESSSENHEEIERRRERIRGRLRRIRKEQDHG